MRNAIKGYLIFNVLSLDVACGAVICSLFFSKVFNTLPSVISLISLGLTVWIIYTTDRLLDVLDIKGEAASERHRFHKKNKEALTSWLLIIAILDLVLIFFLPLEIIKRGVLLFVVVIMYVVFRKRLYIFKEFFVAILYTAGVTLPAIPINQDNVSVSLPLVQFFFIALLNLIIFSWYEKENDIKDKQDSIATKLNDKNIKYILLILFLMAFAIALYSILLTREYYVTMVLVIMTAVHLVITLRKSLFEKNHFYRLAGDAAFLLPLIYLLS